jgi:calcineurin-like phosphoesterase family protein
MKPEDFVVADTHFGHFNVIEYSNRPFKSVEEMDEELIVRWNAKVPKKALVFFLGDMFVGSSRVQIREILDRLHGRICFVRGNHDEAIRGKIASRFEWVKDYYESRTPNHVKCVMGHYAFRVWRNSHHGSWNLHGHSHGSLKDLGNLQLDVGVDTHPNFEPFSYDEICEKMEGRKHIASDHHGAR